MNDRNEYLHFNYFLRDLFKRNEYFFFKVRINADKCRTIHTIK